MGFNPFNAELNPINHFLALLGAHRILHVSSVRVNSAFKGLTTTRWVNSSEKRSSHLLRGVRLYYVMSFQRCITRNRRIYIYIYIYPWTRCRADECKTGGRYTNDCANRWNTHQLPGTHVYNRGKIKTHTQNAKLQLQLRHNQTSTYKQTNNLERCSIYPSDVIPLTPSFPKKKTPCDKSTPSTQPHGYKWYTYTPRIPACDTTCYTGTISPPLLTHPLHTNPPIQ